MSPPWPLLPFLEFEEGGEKSSGLPICLRGCHLRVESTTVFALQQPLPTGDPYLRSLHRTTWMLLELTALGTFGHRENRIIVIVFFVIIFLICRYLVTITGLGWIASGGDRSSGEIRGETGWRLDAHPFIDSSCLALGRLEIKRVGIKTVKDVPAASLLFLWEWKTPDDCKGLTSQPSWREMVWANFRRGFLWV
jgi:hypothetical protein